MMKPFSHQRYNYFYQAFSGGCNSHAQMPLIQFHHQSLSSSTASSLTVLSKITCCQSCFWDFSKESPEGGKKKKKNASSFLCKFLTISGDSGSLAVIELKIMLCEVCSSCQNSLSVLPQAPTSVYLAETCCPSLHAVTL